MKSHSQIFMKRRLKEIINCTGCFELKRQIEAFRLFFLFVCLCFAMSKSSFYLVQQMERKPFDVKHENRRNFSCFIANIRNFSLFMDWKQNRSNLPLFFLRKFKREEWKKNSHCSKLQNKINKYFWSRCFFKLND